MNILVFSQDRRGRSRQFALTHPLALGAIALLIVGIFAGAFAVGMQFGARTGPLSITDIARWSRILSQQKAQIGDLQQRVQARTDALAIRISRLDAHIVRLDELGKRLRDMAHIDQREFNFDEDPPVGGPEGNDGAAEQIPDLTASLSSLEQRADLRDAQLSALETVILSRTLNAAIKPEGRPVLQGFISSYFGDRTDPFTGREEFHKGVDFAGAAGDTVVAVAAGVVTWAGERSGYGTLVEINHGKGYVTRYAHNERVLVTVGQTVQRGQPIALMGSTGRSTGPHVHFEVLHDGRAVDPLTYVQR